ncbi:hypothetical protein [Enterovibrio sp. 27052020O]|uniref:hypothetical protein n=1 Tax=Enterovibrio sp. 27052020O TaxID=3241166 RepID=UPI0038909B5D
MAAEKLTTARLIQILVVMTVLIAAFVWRTLDYSVPKNIFQCEMVANSCHVPMKGKEVSIKLEKQEDTSNSLAIISPTPTLSLHVNLDSDNTILITPEVIEMGNKRAYIYALPDSVKYGPTHKFILDIDQDQIEINF